MKTIDTGRGFEIEVESEPESEPMSRDEQIRAAALVAASQSVERAGFSRAGAVVELAKKFESYIRGES